MPANIFFCYAHEDEVLVNKLKTHLRPLQRQGIIDLWHDRDISAGAEWEQEVKKYLSEAQIILLMVSPDFIDSEYCYSVEMKEALARHDRGEVRVIPIILRPVYWQGILDKLQALPTDAKPVVSSSWHSLDEAFFDVAEGIREVVKSLFVDPVVKLPRPSSTSAFVDLSDKLEIAAKHTLPQDVRRDQKQINLLSNQYNRSYEMMHNFRNELFGSYFRPNVERRKFTYRDWKIFRRLCSYITEGVKASFLEFFSVKGIDIGNDLSVSVKLAITSQEVLEILGENINLTQEQQQQIQSKDLWIVTVFRDYYTHIYNPPREKGTKIYDIDKNTVFRHLVILRETAFCHNDLQSLGEAYDNENNNWEKYYNATLAVPIRYISDYGKQFIFYGVLTVDSLNEKKIKDLFSDVQCKHILAHVADLLATYFLFLECSGPVPN
jgi:hypothetical protein